MNNDLSFSPIGTVYSPYKEKFAIPRQPGLVSAAKGYIELNSTFAHPDTIKSIEQFSHLWVIFVFHETAKQGWKPLVRPPRLGGNKKIGVFATRSTFRPNPIGLSVVKLERIEVNAHSVKLHISGIDLLDQTPVLDIKPYLPYADAIAEASAGFASSSPEANKRVSFSAAAEQVLAKAPNTIELRELIEQVLAQDPRPAYKQGKDDDKTYGITLYHYNILWVVEGDNVIHVTCIEDEPTS